MHFRLLSNLRRDAVPEPAVPVMEPIESLDDLELLDEDDEREVA